MVHQDSTALTAAEWRSCADTRFQFDHLSNTSCNDHLYSSRPTAMSNYTRRVPPPSQQYYAVPQSPRSQGPSRQPSQNQSFSTMPQPAPSQTSHVSREPRDDTTHRVATGQLGAGYGPYSVRFIQHICYSKLTTRAVQPKPATGSTLVLPLQQRTVGSICRYHQREGWHYPHDWLQLRSTLHVGCEGPRPR